MRQGDKQPFDKEIIMATVLDLQNLNSAVWYYWYRGDINDKIYKQYQEKERGVIKKAQTQLSPHVIPRTSKNWKQIFGPVDLGTEASAAFDELRQWIKTQKTK